MPLPSRSRDDAVYTLLSTSGDVLGVAFRVPVLDAERAGTFLLTAGHSVMVEGRSSGEVRAVRGATGDDHGARVLLFPDDQSARDVGLLYVQTYLGPPVELGSLSQLGAVTVRGAPSGVSTEQASLAGEIMGEEWDERNGFVVDVVLSQLGWLERPAPTRRGLLGDEEGTSLAYAALRGLSGSPIFEPYETGASRVVAMVVRRNAVGFANRVYGIPTSAIKAYLSEHGYYLQVAPLPINDVDLGSVVAITGRLMQRILSRPEGTLQLWDEVSELFYMGVPVDTVLRDALCDPHRYHVETGGVGQSHLEFLLARLLFKRGRSVKARALLMSVARRSRRVRTREHQELGALVNLRLILESSDASEAITLRREAFNRAVGQYESLAITSDSERAYELASAFGREASLLPMMDAARHDADELRVYFAWLTAKQRELVRMYPEKLVGKQEIVQIALELVASMYGADGTAGAERLDKMTSHVRRGMAAAAQRENAVFAAQMNLAASALAHNRDELFEAYRLASGTAAALRRYGLQLDHEGVGLVVGYLQANEPALATIVQAVAAHGVAEGLAWLETSGTAASAGVDVSTLRIAGAQSLDWLSGTTSLLDIFGFQSQM